MTQEPVGASPAPERSVPVERRKVWTKDPNYPQEQTRSEIDIVIDETKMRDEMQLRATASTAAIHRAISAQQDTDHTDEAVTVWSARARKVFIQIHQLKAEFFEAVFSDAPWYELSGYADESRRFSSFVKLVFSKLRDIEHLPSSTEVNSWFWLFKRCHQFTEAAVPEAALPQTRKVQEALQSVTKGCRSDHEKVERQIEILQRCSEVMGDNGADSVSTAMVNSAAEELEITPRKKEKGEQLLDAFLPRHLDDMTRTEWDRLISLGLRFRDELKNPKPDYRQRERLLSMSRSFVDLCSHQTTFVLAVLDENDLFQGCLVREMAQKGCLLDRPAQKKKSFFRVHAEADIRVIHGDDLVSAVLPLAARPDELVTYRRLVGCRGDRKLSQLIKVNTGRINPKWRIYELDLEILQGWFSNGNIPVGTYVDEVIEPDWSVPEQDDGIPVL